ncbi:hypothetical protein WJX73_002815 [Symbiochloris irregularis]|uniref:CMP/dCMP-type deaminase domain-containing protein n=1 Tax=Symbiochloris irregularis TaxID=706552 RepID=A0AAW1NP38_9CHLO
MFVLDAGEAQDILRKQSNSGASLQAGSESEDADLIALVSYAQRLAHVAISGFRVGAVARGESGRIYLGVNVELPGLPLNACVHAEQTLITNLLIHREPSVQAVYISAAPCGHCRQFLSELVCAESMTICFGKDMHAHKLADILPERFGPHSLLEKGQDISLLLQPQHHDVSLMRPIDASSSAQSAVEHIVFAAAADKAIQAARTSYTPYYRCPAAAAIIFTPTTGDSPPEEASGLTHQITASAPQASESLDADSGWVQKQDHEIAAGPCMESAAHNPGMLPLQSAIVAGILTGRLTSFDQIVGAVLVECNDTPVQSAKLEAAPSIHMDASVPPAPLSTPTIPSPIPI